MKKISIALTLFLVMAVTAFAGTKIVLNPYDVTMGSNDVQDVSVCISKVTTSGTTPLVGVPITVTNLNASSGFSVAVTQSPTDTTGCGKVQLSTTDASNGKYSFVVNGMKDKNVLVAEIGSANTIPEFTTIGAGIALLGAGAVYMFRKRK
jgi:hypothetical protein